MRKIIFGLAAFALFAMAAIVVPSTASAYNGFGYVEDNPGGREVLILSDDNAGTFELSGTKRFCGQPGEPYANVRNVMHRHGNEKIDWWIDYACNDGYARICVQNYLGETACSTYSTWRR